MNDINISSKFAPKNKILSPYCASKSNKPQEILTLDESQQEKGTTKVKGANVLELNMIFGQKKKKTMAPPALHTHIQRIYTLYGWIYYVERDRQKLEVGILYTWKKKGLFSSNNNNNQLGHKSLIWKKNVVNFFFEL